MKAKGKITNMEVAIAASRILDAGKLYSDNTRSVAASALAQVQEGKATSERVASIASKIFKDDRYSKEARICAGSVLAQTEKAPKGGRRIGKARSKRKS